MNDEKQEIIADIVREMFEYPKSWGEYNHLDWKALADRIETAHKREVTELRECLKEAIREKCPFTRMSCKHGEQCDYECGTEKWRKALEGANDETK